MSCHHVMEHNVLLEKYRKLIYNDIKTLYTNYLLFKLQIQCYSVRKRGINMSVNENVFRFFTVSSVKSQLEM